MMVSFDENIDFNLKKIQTQLILESEFSKEVRIVLPKGQLIKEHKTKFPIVVHVLEGKIDFGVQHQKKTLVKGAVIALEANVPHDLFALENAVVRLSLSKGDTVSRVEKVANTN